MGNVKYEIYETKVTMLSSPSINGEVVRGLSGHACYAYHNK